MKGAAVMFPPQDAWVDRLGCFYRPGTRNSKEAGVKSRSELSAREVEELYSRLQRRLGDTSVPTLPQVAVRILELVSDPNSTIQKFTEVIKTDQALTGRLLRLSNSAQFAQRTPVTRLERAMVLLGMDRLKAMALGFHLSKAAASDDGAFSFKRTWTQSLFRGFLAMKLAEKVNRSCSGEAFIVGLMSDCGAPMMPKLVGADYERSVNCGDSPAKQFLAESRMLEFTHVDVSSVLSRLWKLPDILAKPITNHHTPVSAINAKETSSVLNGAAYFAGMISLSEAGGTGAGEPPTGVAKRLFGLEPEDLDRVIAAAAADFAATREFFGHVIDETLSVDAIVQRANSFLAPEESAAMNGAKPAIKAEALKFSAGTIVVELEPAANGMVAAYIADSTGTRLVSEMIDPRRQNEEQIRSALMLDTASSDEITQVLNGVRRLAA